jgi:hypothetical protein
MRQLTSPKSSLSKRKETQVFSQVAQPIHFFGGVGVGYSLDRIVVSFRPNPFSAPSDFGFGDDPNSFIAKRSQAGGEHGLLDLASGQEFTNDGFGFVGAFGPIELFVALDHVFPLFWGPGARGTDDLADVV